MLHQTTHLGNGKALVDGERRRSRLAPPLGVPKLIDVAISDTYI
jgi:hypothetical protein